MAETPKNSKPSKRTESWWSKNWFYITLVLVAVIGGGCAFTLPYYFQHEGDNIWSLRQAILAATGGVLAILTLWENRRKNIQEKEKNDQDHTRQVHAERRARYAKAVEQLADDKSAIRLGGVYTLAKLVDDWLDDEKTLHSMEKRRQEGQIIIDSLCAYIRSSFPLTERHDELTLSYEEYQQKYQDNQGKNQATQSVENSVDHSTPKAEHQDNKRSNQSREEFVRDKSLFREEQEVRQTILSEIKKRLNGGAVEREDGKHEIKPGTWSYFEYNFLNTVFFYRVGFSNSYFGASLNFSKAEFTDADFTGAEFTDADFTGAKFTQNANFSAATFTQNANFFGAKFTGYAYFSGAEFIGFADFFGTEFTQRADFTEAKFTQNANFYEAKFTDADFTEAKFTQNANFFRAEFTETSFSRARFTRFADFSGAEFTEASFSRAEFTKANFSRAKFTQNADFSAATFTQNADFSKAKFTRFAHFFRAKFTGYAHFFRAKFTEANFPEAEFTGHVDFSKAKFDEKPIFEYALDSETYKARFSHRANPEDYNFEASDNSRYKIETEEKEYDEAKFIIPKGTELFDPDEPSEQNSDNSS